MNKIDPIIITGMHRSGTSLLTRILMEQDIFMGYKLDSNNESVFFQRINKWILSCIGSSWDNPKTLQVLDNEDINLIINRLDKVLNSRFSKSLFLGKKDLFYNQSLNEMNIVWGWKDPVNTFTLCIWKQLFPNAKIININRHPLDVSSSLVNRELKLRIKDKESLFPEFLSSLLPVLSVNKGDVLSSFNIKNINDGLKLNNAFITTALKCVPPEDKPIKKELSNCFQFFQKEIDLLKNLKVIIALGKIAFDACVEFYKINYNFNTKIKFKHNKQYLLPNNIVLLGCYHPSPRNVNTGRINVSKMVLLLKNLQMMMKIK